MKLARAAASGGAGFIDIHSWKAWRVGGSSVPGLLLSDLDSGAGNTHTHTHTHTCMQTHTCTYSHMLLETHIHTNLKTWLGDLQRHSTKKQ